MKRKFTCAVSMILAALMTASPVVSSMQTAFAKTPTDDSTVTLTETADTNQGTAEGTTDDPDVAVSIAYDTDAEYKAGDSVPISVDVSNNETSESELRIYFWNYGKELPEDKDSWSEILTDVSTGVSVEELAETDKMSVEFAGNNGEGELASVQEKEKDGDNEKVTKQYLKLTVPAGKSSHFDLNLKSDEEKDLTIIPTITVNAEEITFDAVQLKWIQNEEKAEEESKDDANVAEKQESEENAGGEVVLSESETEDADNEEEKASESEHTGDASETTDNESINRQINEYTKKIMDELGCGFADNTKPSISTFASNRITSAYIKKGDGTGATSVDIIGWHGDNWTSLDRWHEGILGDTDGWWLFCADPTANFKSGISMTGKNATSVYNSQTVKLVCAVLYYTCTYAKDFCSKITDEELYYYNQTYVWTLLNNVEHWYGGYDTVNFNYGNGITHSCGYPMAGHWNDLYTSALDWANEHMNESGFSASGTIYYNGSYQPLARFEYSYTPKKYTNLTVQKQWVDANNQAGVRPSSVTINLYRDTKSPVDTSGKPYKTAVLNASNNWTYTWKNELKEDGKTSYAFAVSEVVPDNYTCSNKAWTGSQSQGYNKILQNTVHLDTTLTITKKWSDYDNDLGARPSSIKVNVYRGTSSPVSTTGTPYTTVTLSAANNWTVTLKNMPKQYGNTCYSYAVKEATSLSDYSSSQSGWSGSPANGYSKDITNTLLVGYLKLHKDSALPAITNGNKCYSLAGAQYTVYKSYSKGVLSDPVGTLTTQSNGDTNTLRLLRHTYYIKETKAATGYELDNTVYTVTLNGSHTQSSPYLLSVKDVPGNDPSGLTINKIWDGDQTDTIPTLEGTQFTIKYYDGYYTKSNLPSSATKTWVFEIKKVSNRYQLLLTDSYLVKDLSDSLYYDGSGNPCLPYGTISIQETKPAAGYTLNGYMTDSKGNKISTNSEIYVAQINKDSGAVQLQGGNVFNGYNTPVAGSIKIKKYSSDGKTLLPGATFEIKNSKGEVVSEATTNENGELTFSNLYPDVYTITETDTANGHSLLAEPFTVEVPTRITEVYVKDNNIDRNKITYDPADDIYYIHNFTYEVSNSAIFQMPMTGSFDSLRTYIPLIAGFTLILAAGACGIYRKRRS